MLSSPGLHLRASYVASSLKKLSATQTLFKMRVFTSVFTTLLYLVRFNLFLACIALLQNCHRYSTVLSI